MFQHSFVEDASESRKPWTFTVSLLAQSLLVCVAILIPLLSGHRLPARAWVSRWLTPVPPVASSPSSAASNNRVAAKAAQAPRFNPRMLDQPGGAPVGSRAALEVDVAAPVGIAGSIPGGVPGGLFSIRAQPVQPPRLPSAAAPKKPLQALAERPVQVGGRVQQAKLIRRVTPVYPVLARQARIAGVVHLEAIIGKDGMVRELRVLSGHPLLILSALDAVRQWRYEPTLLNGRPVEVITQIEVNFTLSR